MLPDVCILATILHAVRALQPAARSLLWLGSSVQSAAPPHEWTSSLFPFNPNLHQVINISLWMCPERLAYKHGSVWSHLQSHDAWRGLTSAVWPHLDAQYSMESASILTPFTLLNGWPCYPILQRSHGLWCNFLVGVGMHMVIEGNAFALIPCGLCRHRLS